jgi:hypothetical protein
MPPFNKGTAPDLNASAITEHVEMLNNCAEGVGGDLIVSGYGQDPEAGVNLSPLIGRFPVGDIQGTVQFIKDHADERHRNMYMAPAVYSSGLTGMQRGKKQDIVAVLALVADFDDERAGEYMVRLVLPENTYCLIFLTFFRDDINLVSSVIVRI